MASWWPAGVLAKALKRKSQTISIRITSSSNNPDCCVDRHIVKQRKKDQAMFDETHSATRRSWVASAHQHLDFPIQNLPLGVFAPSGGTARGGVAIGDGIFDLAAALELGLFEGLAAR